MLIGNMFLFCLVSFCYETLKEHDICIFDCEVLFEHKVCDSFEG